MTTPAPLVELCHVVIAPGGRTVCRDLNLTLFPGERLAVLGEEASGKSQLFRVMAGLLAPAGGRVLWQGEDLALLSASQRAARIGVLFREPDARFLCATPREEVALTPAAAELTPEALAVRVADSLAMAGLGVGEGDAPWSVLSASRRYRVAVAVCYAARPRLLLADEPGGVLSEDGEEELARKLREFGRQHGMASVIFTSRKTRATLFADRVVRLSAEGAVPWLTSMT